MLLIHLTPEVEHLFTDFEDVGFVDDSVVKLCGSVEDALWGIDYEGIILHRYNPVTHRHDLMHATRKYPASRPLDGKPRRVDPVRAENDPPSDPAQYSTFLCPQFLANITKK